MHFKKFRTVVSNISSKLMVLSAYEYKSMVAFAQAKINELTADFLMHSCRAFQYFSHAKLLHIVRQMTKRNFKKGETIMLQNETSTGLSIIEKGTVSIKRNISNSDIDLKNLPQFSKSKNSATIPLAQLNRGEIFGEDSCRGNSINSYTVTTLSNVSVIFINVKQLLEIFKGKSLELLLNLTSGFHKSDFELLMDHENVSSQKKTYNRLKETALKDTTHYEQRIFKEKDKKMPKFMLPPFDKNSSLMIKSSSEIFSNNESNGLKENVKYSTHFINKRYSNLRRNSQLSRSKSDTLVLKSSIINKNKVSN